MLVLEPVQLAKIEALCTACGVARLELIGSGATEKFDPERSDADFLVEYSTKGPLDAFDRYFQLVEGLEQICNRPIDLLVERAITNPYLRQEIKDAPRQVLYAA